jgi:hypothetical protein
MHARLVHLRISKERLGDAIELVSGELVPSFLSRPGAMHGYWMADRRSGWALAVTCWRDPQLLRAGTAAMGPTAAAVVDAVGAVTIVEAASYEVRAVGGDLAPMGGERLCCRVAFVEALPAAIDGVDERFREAMDRFAPLPGFRTMCWMNDPGTGNGLGLTAWGSEAELRASRQGADQVHQDVAAAFGCRVEMVRDYDVVIAASTPAFVAPGAAPLREPAGVGPQPARAWGT